ncbi:unnamed protein product [Effrenium voratum]|nr:unnamed protein product [Effrenium voratum]
MTPSAALPALRFGVVADVQYADVDDAWNFRRTQVRRYRQALDALRAAVEDWQQGPPLAFVADLGDIIDQQCEANKDSHSALQKVLDAWRGAPAKVFHLVGNHELYNFNRQELRRLIPNIWPWYQSFQPVPGWRVVILDAYEINMIEKDGAQSIDEGIAYLSQHNPNDLRAPRGSTDMGAGLRGLQTRFVPMGGAIKDSQLAWLRQELAAAQSAGERIIVLTHLPFFPSAAVASALLWNFDELLAVLRDFPRGTVPLVLAGHYHDGGYAYDRETHTHHVTIPSALNAEPATALAHGTVELWKDKIVIHGKGLVKSRELPLTPSSGL